MKHGNFDKQFEELKAASKRVSAAEVVSMGDDWRNFYHRALLELCGRVGDKEWLAALTYAEDRHKEDLHDVKTRREMREQERLQKSSGVSA